MVDFRRCVFDQAWNGEGFLTETHPIYLIRYHGRCWVRETVIDPRHMKPVYRRFTWCIDWSDGLVFATRGWAEQFAVRMGLMPGYEIVECAGDEVRF